MIKEMLENYMDYKAEIKTIEYQIKKIELEEVSISGANFQVNGDIRPQGYMASNTENKIIKNADRVRLLEKQKDELQAKIEMIDSLINTLSYYCKNVIISKYINKKSINEICKDIDRSEKTVYRIIEKSMKRMEKLYGTKNR